MTGLLFAYAVVADGLGTRVRVRASRIDQPSGRAVWTAVVLRGPRAAGGLVFPSDTVVLPLEADFSMQATSGRSSGRASSGWCRLAPARLSDTTGHHPRPPSQRRARHSPLRRWRSSSMSKTAWGPISSNCWCAPDDGHCYWAEAIAPGNESAAVEVALEKVVAPLRSAVMNAQPRVPTRLILGRSQLRASAVPGGITTRATPICPIRPSLNWYAGDFGGRGCETGRWRRLPTWRSSDARPRSIRACPRPGSSRVPRDSRQLVTISHD